TAPPHSQRLPYTTLFRSRLHDAVVEGPPGLGLSLKPVGANPAIAIGHPPVFEARGVEHAVTVEPVIAPGGRISRIRPVAEVDARSEEHTSELQLRGHIVC